MDDVDGDAEVVGDRARGGVEQLGLSVVVLADEESRGLPPCTPVHGRRAQRVAVVVVRELVREGGDDAPLRHPVPDHDHAVGVVATPLGKVEGPGLGTGVHTDQRHLTENLQRAQGGD